MCEQPFGASSNSPTRRVEEGYGGNGRHAPRDPPPLLGARAAVASNSARRQIDTTTSAARMEGCHIPRRSCSGRPLSPPVAACSAALFTHLSTEHCNERQARHSHSKTNLRYIGNFVING
ncbi:hypothetical protein HPB50_018376 [Hyalomma asiaticum]|uniref:Uncharacterized protein n=1 Tax=Hyalomma asiaticum TaxID=266040 RepID=A0ACB7TK28_HYAAI|nr:hypothetical protein HPB50_018376 [Hyalomma asiaticum]